MLSTPHAICLFNAGGLCLMCGTFNNFSVARQLFLTFYMLCSGLLFYTGGSQVSSMAYHPLRRGMYNIPWPGR